MDRLPPGPSRQVVYYRSANAGSPHSSSVRLSQRRGHYVLESREGRLRPLAVPPSANAHSSHVSAFRKHTCDVHDRYPFYISSTLAGSTPDRVRTPKQPYCYEVVQEVYAFVRRELCNDALDTQMLCKRLGMSRMHLHRMIKKATGMTTTSFVHAVRLEVAEEMLRSGYCSVKQVAYEVGYKDPAYFSRVFTKQYGMCPSHFQKQVLKRF